MDIHSIEYAIVMKYHDGAVCCNTTYLVLYMLVQHVCIIRGGRNDMYSICIADSSGGIDTEQQCSYSTVQYSTVQCVDLLKEPLVWHRFHTRLTPDHRNAHFGII